MSDESLRKALYGGHPPTCTCVECTKNRLRRGMARRGGHRSLRWSKILIVAAVIVGIGLLTWAILSARGLA